MSGLQNECKNYFEFQQTDVRPMNDKNHENHENYFVSRMGTKEKRDLMDANVNSLNLHSNRECPLTWFNKHFHLFVACALPKLYCEK